VQFGQSGVSSHEPGELDRQVPLRPLALLTLLGCGFLDQSAHLAGGGTMADALTPRGAWLT
jgi:hypothetical protein